MRLRALFLVALLAVPAPSFAVTKASQTINDHIYNVVESVWKKINNESGHFAVGKKAIREWWPGGWDIKRIIQARKWKTYGDPEHSFSRPTSYEIDQAVLAKQVSIEHANKLRSKGFLPINEIAGGTPYYDTRVEGWKYPLRDGTPTFPETDR